MTVVRCDCCEVNVVLVVVIVVFCHFVFSTSEHTALKCSLVASDKVALLFSTYFKNKQWVPYNDDICVAAGVIVLPKLTPFGTPSATKARFVARCFPNTMPLACKSLPQSVHQATNRASSPKTRTPRQQGDKVVTLKEVAPK